MGGKWEMQAQGSAAAWLVWAMHPAMFVILWSHQGTGLHSAQQDTGARNAGRARDSAKQRSKSQPQASSLGKCCCIHDTWCAMVVRG